MFDIRGIEKKFQNLFNLPDRMHEWSIDIRERIDLVNRRRERNFVLVLIQGFVVDTIYNFKDPDLGVTLHDKEVITNKPVSMAMSGFLPHNFSDAT